MPLLQPQKTNWSASEYKNLCKNHFSQKQRNPPFCKSVFHTPKNKTNKKTDIRTRKVQISVKYRFIFHSPQKSVSDSHCKNSERLEKHNRLKPKELCLYRLSHRPYQENVRRILLPHCLQAINGREAIADFLILKEDTTVSITHYLFEYRNPRLHTVCADPSNFQGPAVCIRTRDFGSLDIF